MLLDLLFQILRKNPWILTVRPACANLRDEKLKAEKEPVCRNLKFPSPWCFFLVCSVLGFHCFGDDDSEVVEALHVRKGIG